MAKTTTWKIACAIGHDCLDKEPDVPSAVEAFKQRCATQGIDYRAPSPTDRRPLHGRVFDYLIHAREMRRRSGG